MVIPKHCALFGLVSLMMTPPIPSLPAIPPEVNGVWMVLCWGQLPSHKVFGSLGRGKPPYI